MAAMAYDPSIGMFENKALIEIMRAEMAETERLIRQLLPTKATPSAITLPATTVILLIVTLPATVPTHVRQVASRQIEVLVFVVHHDERGLQTHAVELADQQFGLNSDRCRPT